MSAGKLHRDLAARPERHVREATWPTFSICRTSTWSVSFDAVPATASRFVRAARRVQEAGTRPDTGAVEFTQSMNSSNATAATGCRSDQQ